MIEDFNTAAFSVYFDELFHDFHAFQYRFYVSFSMLMVFKIIAKKASWPRRDSNTQPSDLESDALPLRHGVHM